MQYSGSVCSVVDTGDWRHPWSVILEEEEEEERMRMFDCGGAAVSVTSQESRQSPQPAVRLASASTNERPSRDTPSNERAVRGITLCNGRTEHSIRSRRVLSVSVRISPPSPAFDCHS